VLSLSLADPKKQPPENGLRRALDVQLVENLLDVAEKFERNSQAIARLKTIWCFVAVGIALVVAALEDWLFGRK